MLKKLTLEEFTVFQEASLEFAPGINVVIGENGLGKSHILKLAYALHWISHEVYKKENKQDSAVLSISNDILSKSIAAKLIGMFRPEHLGRLVHRRKGRNKTNIYASFSDGGKGIEFSFSTNSKTEVTLRKFDVSVSGPSVFVPAGDVISMMPFLKDAWSKYPLMLDEGYNDLSAFLDKTVPVGQNPREVGEVIRKIEKLLNGKIIFENGRFYLQIRKEGKMEMPLVAEGFRKIAMLGHIVANRSIQSNSLLLWDEPECNLNPKLIRALAEVMTTLASNGTQIIIATHSLFLLRELDLCERSKKKGKTKTSSRYFALRKTDDRGIVIDAYDRVEDLTPLASLDAEIEQSDRYIEESENIEWVVDNE